MSFSKGAVMGVVVVVIVASVVAGTYLVLTDRPESSSRSSISIGSDASFTEDNGVRSGSGTPEDPYLISDWVIRMASTTTGATGVNIYDTSAHFVIRNVTISGPHYDFETPHLLFRGISLWSVSNGTITSCSLTDLDVAVDVYDCRDISVSGNRISSCRCAIESYQSFYYSNGLRDCVIENNTFADTLCGIFLRYPWNVTVSGNTFFGCRYCSDVISALQCEFSGNTVDMCDVDVFALQDSIGCEVLSNDILRTNGSGILASRCSEMTVRGNDVRSSGVSLSVQDCDMVSILSNTFSNLYPWGIGSTNIGLHVQDSTNVTVVSNVARSNDVGVLLSKSESSSMSVVLYHNSIYGNDVQAIDGCGEENQWDGGSAIGGNYWPIEGMVDENIDGVADEPYWIDSDSVDRYPLVNPP